MQHRIKSHRRTFVLNLKWLSANLSNITACTLRTDKLSGLEARERNYSSTTLNQNTVHRAGRKLLQKLTPAPEI